MEAEELLASLSAMLDIDLPFHAREHFTKELYYLAVHENRLRAESQGIGAESQLSKKILYSVQEALDADENLRREGDWFYQYTRAIYFVCYSLAKANGLEE